MDSESYEDIEGFEEYRLKCEAEKQKLQDGIDSMDKAVTGDGLLISRESKAFPINGVFYNRKQARAAYQRIESRLKGLRRWVDKIQSDEWGEFHTAIIEVIADSDFELHHNLDAKFYLLCSHRGYTKAREVTKKDPGFKKRQFIEMADSAKSYLDTVILQETNNPEVRDQWIQNRFFELCSLIEFDVLNGAPFPSNPEIAETIPPLDIVVYGDLTIDDAKQLPEYYNFVEMAQSECRSRGENS